MNMQDFFNEFFVKPIYERSGYNPVNTTVYAFIALLTIYIVYKWWKSKGIRFNSHFLISLLPYVILGSTKRVITDIVDKLSLEGLWKLYEYNVINISPGIYITTGFLFIFFYYLEKRGILPTWSSFWVGLFLAMFHLFLLFPFIQNIQPLLYVIPLAVVGGTITFFIGKRLGFLAGFSQGLDGAATYYAIEFLHYNEQHVIPSFIGENFGYIWFYIAKVIIAFLFVWLLEKEEKDEDKKVLGYAIVIIAGLAPGLRDLLRMMAGA